jgi:hypothetical protein
MLEIFNRNIKSKYQERLTKAFPKELHSDLKIVFSIIPFENHKVKLFDGTIHQVDNLIHESEVELVFGSETLTVPYRLYFDEPKPELEKTLTHKQRDILNCIYLRHHNGHLREKRLNLLSMDSEKWTVPFVAQLLGEYVYELLPIIESKMNENTLTFYVAFRAENPKYWQQTESRMISYWNEYYRYKFPKLKEYLGYKIINSITKRANSNSLNTTQKRK